MAHLVVVDGPVAGLVLPLAPGPKVIGRAPSADLVVPDDAVSRNHCRLEDDGGSWRICDLGSLNAIQVNGEQITDYLLEDGDEIRVGESTLRFVESPGELISLRGQPEPTLRIEGGGELAAGASTAWRAERLDELLHLSERVVGARSPGELLRATAAWLADTLGAARTAVYRPRQRGTGRLQLVHEHAVRASGPSESTLVLDAQALDDVVRGGKTIWLERPGLLVAPIGGPPPYYVAVAQGVTRSSESREWDLRFVACAARLVGGALAPLGRLEALERAAEEARIAVAGGGEILTESPAMDPLLRFVERAALSDATVLFSGESGSGKELAARAIHAGSPRAAGPFVAVNCAALPEQLLESELFGHERGAFTGAVDTRRGRFERADGGTLFLDEVGELSPAAQARLLRALEERVIERVGGERPIGIDVRIVAASNRDLWRMTERGELRQDLYYRLAVLSATVPPLRERPEDVPLLARHFMDSISAGTGVAPRPFGEAAMDCLRRHTWPGNVRELRNAVEHAAALSTGGAIEPEDLPPYLRDPDPVTQDGSSRLELPASLRQVERAAVSAALEETGGNKAQAARLLGINRATLYAKIRLYGLDGA